MKKPRSRNNSQPQENFSRGKIRALLFLVSILFLFVIGFLVRWQIIDNERFQALASSRFQRKEIPALRGDILANDGTVLAYSEPRFDIYVFKNEEHGLIAAENAGRQTRAEFLEKVSQVLEVEEGELIEKLDQDTQWIKIADDITREKRDLVVSIPTNIDPDVFLDGISFEEDSVRLYPEKNLAANVIGYLGKDDFGHDQGGAGLEQYFDGVLKPQAGISTIETDSNEQVIAIASQELKDARRGATLKTTIDKNLQSKVEKHLKEGVERFQARSGTVIIIDPRTGEIMVMANYPSFDPNSYEDADPLRLGNPAINNPYEIGSVGKVFTMSAAVDQGKVHPDTIVIEGHKGCEEIIENRIICTYDKKPKPTPMSATDAMINSDNLALFHTAQLIGQEKLADYLESFGMGKKTGVQLSGEDSGYIKPGELWNEADLAAYSYGHSYFQTPLQSAVGISALANKGKLMEPMIVEALIESDGSAKNYEPRVVDEVLTEENAKIIGDILYEVYKHNLYEQHFKDLAKYRIGMKSGTALIPYTALTPPQEIPGYSEEVNATYVGYDGSDKNTFLMLVNVSEPQTKPKLSYNNARILWLEIFADIKDDLGVPVYYN